MTLPLTAKQERVWRYIRSCKRSPSYRQMSRDLGYSSIGALSDTVAALCERGYVTYLPGRARSVVAIDPSSDLSRFPTEVLISEVARRFAG